jgi:alpha-tubulin suppressor-like RCC1 family protein
MCWGWNGNGELGNGSPDNWSNIPVPVSGLNNATAISSGNLHSCALLSTRSVMCWGDNVVGQLGNDSPNNSRVPVPVSGLTNANAISAGGYHSCAVLSTGEVMCWGDNSAGQLGNDSLNDSRVPVPVSGLTNAVAISVGFNHSCALLFTREVMCWGMNSDGQLGSGSPDNLSDIPVPVSGLTNAVAISVGFEHSCAVLSTREVMCWGDNSAGQLGNDSPNNSRVPVPVSGLTNASAVSVGAAFSCALLTTAGVTCWGDNSDGQLGNDSLNDSRVPVPVLGLSSGVGITTTTTTTTSTVPVVVRAAALVSAPASVSYRAANKGVTLRWRAVEGATSYVVTTTSGAQVCAATTTSCVVNRLRNGRAYDYNVFAVNADGVRSTTGAQVSTRPGFQVRTTTVRTNKSVSLSSIATTPSKGKKTWTVTSGACRINGARLVTPMKKGSCKLRLSTARSGSYAAMSTTITVTVR